MSDGKQSQYLLSSLSRLTSLRNCVLFAVQKQTEQNSCPKVTRLLCFHDHVLFLLPNTLVLNSVNPNFHVHIHRLS